MIELFAALVIALQGPPPPPTDLRLETFKAACIPHRRDVARTAQALAADGWVQVPDDDHPELAATMGKSRAEMVQTNSDDPPMVADFTVWAKSVEGRRFHVVVNRVDATLRQEADDDGDGVIQDWEKADHMTLLGCGLWDFDATERVPNAAVTAWVGQEPGMTQDQSSEMVGGVWNMFHMLPGSGDLYVGFIPEGSAFGAASGFTGVALTLSSAPEATDPAAEADTSSPAEEIDIDAD